MGSTAGGDTTEEEGENVYLMYFNLYAYKKPSFKEVIQKKTMGHNIFLKSCTWFQLINNFLLQ